MSLEALMVDDITILSPTWTADRYGDLTADWTNPTETTTKGRLTRRDALEVIDGRDATVTRWLMYLPATVAVSPFDRVEIDTVLYEVDGPALLARGMHGDGHHLEVTLRAVTG